MKTFFINQYSEKPRQNLVKVKIVHLVKAFVSMVYTC